MSAIDTISVGAGRRGRSVIAWILLFAFTVQSHATQIHVHGSSHAIAGASIEKIIEKAGSHGKSPGAPDSTDCPICQAIAHTGVFFAPTVPLLLLPGWVEHFVPSVRQFAVAGAAATHEWFSRAPPRN
jgi:Protein of unknown function (DUF2946)